MNRWKDLHNTLKDGDTLSNKQSRMFSPPMMDASMTQVNRAERETSGKKKKQHNFTASFLDSKPESIRKPLVDNDQNE